MKNKERERVMKKGQRKNEKGKERKRRREKGWKGKREMESETRKIGGKEIIRRYLGIYYNDNKFKKAV